MNRETEIIRWAQERSIFDCSNPYAQLAKTVEELGELARAVSRDDMDGIMDGIGDVVVTLVLLAAMNGTSVADCVEVAYQQISDRQGSVVNGVFVKDK